MTTTKRYPDRQHNCAAALLLLAGAADPAAEFRTMEQSDPGDGFKTRTLELVDNCCARQLTEESPSLPPLQAPGHGFQSHFLHFHHPPHFCG